jgi:hypothetical protein
VRFPNPSRLMGDTLDAGSTDASRARFYDRWGAQIAFARSLGRAAQTPRARSSHAAPGPASRDGP